MDLVGLVSGGKDSIYNLLEAVRLGHRVVCVANLHPAPPAAPAASATSEEEAPQELDSWMYQTVGWNVVPALCQALGLPLHRQVTRGQAVHTGLAYPAAAAAAGDEVEDLHALLAGVLAAHPSVRGVAVGAILSTYQRVRVESVCARLGLVPVALLWQRQQRGLLQDMAACGLRALLVKVASHGLTPERHLGREAGALLPALLRLHAQLGLHVCGEGGEYETLALDSPLHARGVVEVGQSKVVTAPGAGSGATAHLHITEAAVRERAAGEAGTVAPHWRQWDWRQRAAEAAAAAAEAGGALLPQLGGASSRRRRLPQHAPLPPFVFCPPPPPPPLQHGAAAAEEEALPPAPSPFGRPPGAALQGDTLLLALESVQPAGAGAAAAGARALLQQVRAALAAAGGALGDVVNVHLSLSDMTHFQEVNAVFQAAFAGGALAQNPPSRSCLQFSASAGSAGSVRVELEALCVLGSARSAALGHASHRRTLLVASLSRWAPMCIGPYAQCVTLDDALVYPAGQIGLLPETMALVGGGLVAQLQQALLNLARVGSCAGTAVPCAISMAVFVARAEFDEAAARAAEACVGEWDAGRRAAAAAGEEEEEEGGEEQGQEEGAAEGEEYEFSLGPYAGAPPAYHHCSPPLAAPSGAPLPTGTLHPCAVIPVAALPRGAAAEVEALCLTGEAIALCGGLQLCAEEDSSAGGGAALLHYCARARALQGCVGCAWVGATGQWGEGQWQALAEGVAARALRALRAGSGSSGSGSSSGSLAGAAASWAVRAFYEAASGAEAEGEVQAERRGLGAALRAALGGCAAQVAVAMVPLCSSSAEWRAGAAGAAPQPPLLLLPVPAARGAAAAPGQRTLLLQVTAYNAGAMRGQLWLRRAYKSAGVTE